MAARKVLGYTGRRETLVAQSIDLERIREIEMSYGDLAPLEAYYRKRLLDYETIGPMVPQTGPLLAQALSGRRRVLDVGCGDGRTLLDCSPTFDHGIGYDESVYALEAARADAVSRNITNVEFIRGKAVNLPFDDEHFDFVYTERGPLGHADSTLEEAMRVLEPGGRIFVETGAWTGGSRTALTNLEEERDRFERFGVKLEILASRIEQQRFADIYTWFEMQCTVARYFEKDPPFEIADDETLLGMVAEAGGDDRVVVRPYHTIWVGGTKDG